MSTSGWNLQQGTIPFRPLSESGVIRIVNVALSPAKMHTTTYKYAFFKAVLDNLFNVNLESHFLDYDAIALRFTEIYWNLVLNFHLKQMPASQRTAMTAVERKLFEFCWKHGFDHSQKQQIFPFESLRSDLQLEVAKAIRREMLKYVVGAFYKDTEGQLYSLEHFGITRDNTVPWLSPVEEKKYLDGIEWKRQFHQQNGTKLIETYSYYVSEGILFEQLERILKENAIPLQPRDFNDIFEIIYSKKSNKYFSDFISLCCTFISLFKARSYDMEELDRMILACSQQDNKFIAARNRIFLSIVKYVLSQYQQYLEETKSIDFSDMINLATKQVENGCEIYNYKYIIVDEYQDISLARFRLLKSILNRTKARFLCVGNDWQSIYRFAGSDIALFTKFEDYLGFTKLLKIEKTYRNSQQLIDEASHFVTKNPNQLQKSLTSDKALRYPLVFWGIDSNFSEVLNLVLKKIIMDFGADKSILLLGRTNYDRKLLEDSGLFLFRREQRAEKIVYRESPQTPISFLSVHKSKGLEADNVVLLNFTNDRLGFPNQIADDKVLDFVLTDGCTFPFEEERRLFYVAITRTKNRTFILTENKNPSVFFKEFKQSDAVCFVSIKSAEDKGQTKCPRCKTGDLLKVSKNGKTFVGCSNFPRCDYTINDSSVLANPKKCPSCGGFLVKRRGKSNHWFVGCSNYPYCTHTEQLNKM